MLDEKLTLENTRNEIFYHMTRNAHNPDVDRKFMGDLKERITAQLADDAREAALPTEGLVAELTRIIEIKQSSWELHYSAKEIAEAAIELVRNHSAKRSPMEDASARKTEGEADIAATIPALSDSPTSSTRRIHLDPEKLAKVCEIVRAKNEDTVEYNAATAIREYKRLEGPAPDSGVVEATKQIEAAITEARALCHTMVKAGKRYEPLASKANSCGFHLGAALKHLSALSAMPAAGEAERLERSRTIVSVMMHEYFSGEGPPNTEEWMERFAQNIASLSASVINGGGA